MTVYQSHFIPPGEFRMRRAVIYPAGPRENALPAIVNGSPINSLSALAHQPLIGSSRHCKVKLYHQQNKTNHVDWEPKLTIL